MRVLLFVMVLSLFFACTKESDKDTKEKRDNQDTTQEETAMDPIPVSGIFLTCTPAAQVAGQGEINCAFTDSTTKKRVNLEGIMKSWDLTTKSTSALPAGVAGTEIKVVKNAPQDAYQFKITAAGSTPEAQLATLESSVVVLNFENIGMKSAAVEYDLKKATERGGEIAADTAVKPVIPESQPIAGSQKMDLAAMLVWGAEGKLTVQQDLPPEATGVVALMDGGATPASSPKNPLRSTSYFGVSTLEIKGLWISYDLSFVLNRRDCRGKTSFALSAEKLVNNVTCQ